MNERPVRSATALLLQTVKEGMINWAFKQGMIVASNKKAMKKLDKGIEWVRYARQLEP